MGKSRPTGPHSGEMTGEGTWPETDEDVYTNRATELGRTLTAVTDVLMTWENHQASIFNGVHVWSGDASKAAGAAVDGATRALKTHQQQLRDAISWCNDAAGNIVSAKGTITSNVTAGQLEIHAIEQTAVKTNNNPDGVIRAIVQRKYGENVATINALAVGLGAKLDLPQSPVDDQRGPSPNGQSGPSDAKD